MIALARMTDAPEAGQEPAPPAGPLVKFRPLRERRSERLTRHDRERLKKEAADADAARRAAAPQGWAQQPRASRERQERWTLITAAMLIGVVGMLVIGMLRAERQAGQGATVSNNEQTR